MKSIGIRAVVAIGIISSGCGQTLKPQEAESVSEALTIVQYEAESAGLSGSARVNTNHRGYSGTGFVDGFYYSTTAQVAFAVNAAAAGSYTVTLRYSAGNGTSSNTGLYLNGTKIKTVTFNATSNWDTWADKTETLTLKAGNNTISYKAESSVSSCINLDKLTVTSTACAPSCAGKCGGSDGCRGTCPNTCVAPQTCGGGGTANVCGCAPSCTGKCGGSDGCGGTCPSCGTSYEAENATLSGGAAKNTNHSGYSGSGFVDGYFNSTTALTTFTVTVGAAGSATLTVRYSAGNGASSNTGLYVNGTKIKNISFGATSSWNTWADKTETVTLRSGSNTVAFKAETSSTACVNLDKLTVTANTCTPSCSGKCAGSDGCGGTCPNTCVAPQTCGGGGTANVCGCTPSSSACGTQQCGTASDGCGGTVSCGTCQTGQTCSGEGQCTCWQKSSDNLLTNPGFDGSATGWSLHGGAAYSSADADTCSGSGSVALASLYDSFSQCVPMVGNAPYNFGLKYKGVVMCDTSHYTGANCTGEYLGGTTLMDTTGKASWAPINVSAYTEVGTTSLLVHCSAAAGAGSYDQFYVTPGKPATGLLTNPGFDGTTTGWDLRGGAIYSSVDADGVAGSGSVALASLYDSFSQCVPMVGNAPYNFGLKYKGVVMCDTSHYTGANCTGEYLGGTTLMDTTGKASWAPINVSAYTEVGTTSLLVHCSAAAGAGSYDQFVLRTGT